MKSCRITVMKRCFHEELARKYENPIEHACDVQEGDIFVSENAECPTGMCQAAWLSLQPFVMALANGAENFYDGWMKNPKSAMISCNDGFRPVSFLVEVIENS
ncbi:MAG: TIGR04076 family protein [Bacteroidales bacterium]|nr:TIGR04076 family protein [Bacteroidales bacterium]